MDKHELKAIVKEIILERGEKKETDYRQPLVGVASASDPLFMRIKGLIDPDYRLPEDLLRGASSVLAYFIPFAPRIPHSNREKVSYQWALAYQETNTLIGEVNTDLMDLLKERGINSASEAATHNFDQEKLISLWSHKHTALVAGLGSFGHHQMLITERGCAGRFGSLVLDLNLEADERSDTEYCLHMAGKECRVCIDRCPVGALTEDGLDKAACYRYCQENDHYYSQLEATDVCGMCATGPCALDLDDQ